MDWLKSITRCTGIMNYHILPPHVLRHTFCTNMANARMTPNNLQYIMGHKNITMTLGYYTHASCESAMTEMLSIVA